jgi:hypothetical protein
VRRDIIRVAMSKLEGFRKEIANAEGKEVRPAPSGRNDKDEW